MKGKADFIPLENGKWIKVYSDGNIITNCDLISFDCVLDRWKGATFKEIHTIILEGKLYSYFRNKSLRKASGIEHYLYPLAPDWNSYGEGYFQNYGGIVCLLPDILTLENEYSDFLYEPVPDSEALSTPPEPSPVDWTPSDGKPSDMPGYAQMIEQLEEARRRANEAEKRALNAERSAAAATLSPAQKAALAKSEKSLKAWLEVLPAMLHVAVRCGEEGKKPRQTPDFNVMFNELDAALTDSQMRRFRSSLPEGYSDKAGGKPGKI